MFEDYAKLVVIERANTVVAVDASIHSMFLYLWVMRFQQQQKKTRTKSVSMYDKNVHTYCTDRARKRELRPRCVLFLWFRWNVKKYVLDIGMYACACMPMVVCFNKTHFSIWYSLSVNVNRNFNECGSRVYTI